MKLQSKIFDTIRIKPRREEKPEAHAVPCDFEGCDQPGEYRAPKGARSEGQYHHFCLEHVRHYNNTFNFFAGMDKDELAEALYEPPKAEKRASFATGQGRYQQRTARTAQAASAGPQLGDRFGDPFGVFARYRFRQKQQPASERVKPIHEQDRRALETLGLAPPPKSDEIKQAYKRLVKIHHPDANGGDKASEERLRSIIAAYAHLKKVGLVAK